MVIAPSPSNSIIVMDPVLIQCSHRYHRSCILRWIDDGYDECFECRQPLWDAETYCYIDKLVKQKGYRRSGTSNK
jgi:Zinc finger, C3HC4 type (RING finger)